MRRLTTTIFAMLVCIASTSVYAQQFGWSQYSVSYNYESLGGTYEKTGSTLSVDMDAHWRSPVYCSFLAGYSWYDGYKAVTIDYGDRLQNDNLSDKKTQLMFAVGPGFDLLSNNIDRFYLTLYGGYAIVKYEHDAYIDTERVSKKDDLNGIMCLGRIGYEHQISRSMTIGLFAQAAYVGKEFNWGVGLRIGFRTSDFNVKKPIHIR